MTKVPRFSMLVLGVACLLGTALPAAAQPLPQDPAAQTPPPPPPPVTTTTTTTTNVTPLPGPMAPMSAPKSADDMTGSIGFGVGVIPNGELAGTDGNVHIKYWMSNMLVLVPALTFALTKPSGDVDATWLFAPEAVFLFSPFVATSTRLLVGGGAGFALSKATPGQMDTQIAIYLPVQAGVEHFFTSWLAMGIALRHNLFQYQKLGDIWQMDVAIDTRTSLLGSITFYTD
jgi:hypothetical protein